MADNSRNEAARAEGAKVQDRVKEKVTEIGGGIADMGHRVVDTVQEKVHDLRDLASEKYTAGKDKLVELEAKLADKVQASPVKSVLIAVGVGALLAFLWRRR